MVINKNIPVPLYFQLKELLQHDIARGQYKPGDLIPTEMQLMEQYDLSRTPVRQAINALVSEGYLTRKKGVGTTVLAPQQGSQQNDLRRQIKSNGFVHTTKLLSFEETVADSSIADHLSIEEGTPIYIMERLRLGNDIPLVYSRTYIAQKTAPSLPKNIEEASKGFHKYLANIGKKVCRVKHITEAGVADDKAAMMLNLRKNTPIVLLTDDCYTVTGQVAEHTISLVNTSVLKLTNIEYLK